MKLYITAIDKVLKNQDVTITKNKYYFRTNGVERTYAS